MGKSIDIAIKNGSDLIDVFKEYFPNDKAIDTVNGLVEIATRYQKIEQIVKSWNDMNSFDSMVQISEVVKDATN